MRRSETPVSLSRTFTITFRSARLAQHLYKIDHSDPRHVVVHVADDLTPAQEARADEAIEADLQALAHRRRRADLAPVAELERDETDPGAPELTGTDGEDRDEVALAKASLSVVR